MGILHYCILSKYLDAGMAVCICNSKSVIQNSSSRMLFFSFFLCKTDATTVVKRKQAVEGEIIELQSLVLQPWKKLLPWSKEENSEAFLESLVLSARDCMVQALDLAPVFSELHKRQGKQKSLEGNFGDSVGRNSVAGLLRFSFKRSQACLHKD